MRRMQRAAINPLQQMSEVFENYQQAGIGDPPEPGQLSVSTLSPAALAEKYGAMAASGIRAAIGTQREVIASADVEIEGASEEDIIELILTRSIDAVYALTLYKRLRRKPDRSLVRHAELAYLTAPKAYAMELEQLLPTHLQGLPTFEATYHAQAPRSH